MQFDMVKFITDVSYLGIFFIIFAESGLLIGFFFPGDSLLFTAGFLASKGILNEWILLPLVFVAAVLGDNVGYWFGKKIGPKLFNKENSLFFNKDHVLKAQAFYEKHGVKTIVLARFVPVIRTFAPIVAGVGHMHYYTFIMFNLIGGLLWAVGISLAGLWLGSIIPDVDRYLLPIVFVIILLSISPGFIHFFKEKENRSKVKHLFKRYILRSVEK
jgi:membrane-associated protein